MVKTRTISKSCPKCEHMVPVASKACTKCKFAFKAKNLRSSSRMDNKADNENEGRRRTSRIRVREKPNFYDSQQFEKKKKKQKRKENLNTRENLNSREKKILRVQRKEEQSEGHMLPTFSEDKQRLAALLLAEINRKIGIVQWKPT